MEEENIKVAVRIRPIQSAERKDGDIACVKASPDGKEVQVKVGPLEASSYRCDQCFPNDTTQAEFFNECGITELLDSAMKGYRACAFAFGQTGAGKTFTVVGAPKGASNREKQSGLISRSLEYLFHKLEAAGVQFAVKLSCLEIYHEQVFDLFADEKDRAPLSVREHAVEGFFIEGCKLVDCASFPIANAALDAAVKNRQIGSHDLNSRSSRSHCLTEVHIEIPVTVGADGAIGGGVSYGESGNPHGGLAQGEYMSRGKISLVDLAGSERLKTTKSTGKVLQEAGFINKSLYVLGKVIAGLIRTNGDLNHKDVPYRDSKLTKLLISSLGGRSRTLLISCVSEAKSNQAETLRTLKFR
jgi:kinesin family protein 12